MGQLGERGIRGRRTRTRDVETEAQPLWEVRVSVRERDRIVLCALLPKHKTSTELDVLHGSVVGHTSEGGA